MSKKQISPFGLRMPDELKKYLEQQAKLNKRSMNSELVYRLELSRKEADIDHANPSAQ